MSEANLGAMSGKGGSAKAVRAKRAGGSSSLLGSLAEFFELTSWSFDPKAAIPKHASNATGGAKDGIFGVRDSSGTLETLIHETDGMPFGPGQLVKLQLDAGDGKIPNTLGTNYIEVMARIEGAPVNVAIDGEGEGIKVTYNWQGVRPWTGYGIFAKMWVVERTDT
jgi:hypothetical protein